MNLEEIQDSARRFSKSVKDIEQFFARNHKHIEHFTNKPISSLNYVMLSPEGLVIGVDNEYELNIHWEDFLQYLYKDVCKY